MQTIYILRAKCILYLVVVKIRWVGDVVLSQVALCMASAFDIWASAQGLFPEMALEAGFGGAQGADEAYQMFYNLLKSG